MQTHSLMHLLTDFRSLKKAARQCMARRSSPGLDGVRWSDYRNNLDLNIEGLSAAIKSGSWQPKQCKIIYSTSFAGTPLIIHVPVVEDRIVHRTLRNIIEPILDIYAFHDFVSGFRRGRSRLTSIQQGNKFLSKGFKSVISIDIYKISENIHTEEVIDLLAMYISDGKFLNFIRKTLDGLPSPLAIGGGLTPTLVSLRLVPTDNEIQNWNVVRFGDNYCIFCESITEAEEKLEIIRDILFKRNLKISPEKSEIITGVNPEDLFLI